MIPHDPIEGGNAGDPCNIDGEPWPCPMRLAQRSVLRECHADGATAVVETPGGDEVASTDRLTVGWLDGALP